MQMNNRVIPISTDSTRNLCKSVIFAIFFTFGTIKLSQSVYRYILRKSTMSSSASTSSTSDDETLRRSRILKSKLYFDVPLSKVNIYINYISLCMCVCVIGLRFLINQVPVIYTASYDIAFLGIEKL